MSDIRAIMVSVGYHDILGITLPWNKERFDEVWIVTTPGSKDAEVAKSHGAKVFETGAFHDNGAVFNKFLCLEQGLDAMGRHGWICCMDADVLWPKSLTIKEAHGGLTLRNGPRGVVIRAGQLCTPLRRMWVEWPNPPGVVVKWQEQLPGIPLEEYWVRFPVHPNVAEWAGYSQIFHAADPALGEPPWHDVGLTSAGTADSWFQRKWHHGNKVRPPFDCLHLGPSGQNWMGRVTPHADGTVPPEAADRAAKLREMFRQRQGKRGMDAFAHERIDNKDKT